MKQPASTDSNRGQDLKRTRQQLRDLDNILEQMLALPIADRPRRVSVEEPPEPPRTALSPMLWPPPAEIPAPQIHLERIATFIPAAAPADERERLDPGHDEPSDSMVVLDQQREHIGLDDASLRALFEPTVIDGHTVEHRELPKVEMATSLQPPATPSLFHHLLLVPNHIYDRFADTLWPFSGLLKWSGTRNLLGLLGILMLAAASVWLVVTLVVWQ